MRACIQDRSKPLEEFAALSGRFAGSLPSGRGRPGSAIPTNPIQPLPKKRMNRHHRIQHITRRFALMAGIAGLLAVPCANADTTITTGTTLAVTDPADFIANAGAVTIENGATLHFVPNVQDAYTIDNALVMAGSGGNINLRFQRNDTEFTLTGPITSTATGAQTLAIAMGYGNNGDRETATFNSAIPDVGDASPLSLQVTFSSQSGAACFLNLNAVNTFSGPITLTSTNAFPGYLSIGGKRDRFGNTPGTGSLGGGTYAGNIAMGLNTVLSHDSTAPQTLSGTISGLGLLRVDGGGVLTLSGANTYTTTTQINSGTLVLAEGGSMTFAPTAAASNKITGAGTATLNGIFTIDTSAVSVATGSWTLVDSSIKSFGSTFSVAGFDDSDLDNIWTKQDGPRTWSFNEADGVLSLNSLAVITSFGIPGYAGIVNNNVMTINLYVPSGTDLATLAPTFTLTSGTCDPVSGAAPSPSFAVNNPATYTVTDGAAGNVYTVTVTELPAGFVTDGLVVWLAADAVDTNDSGQVRNVDSDIFIKEWNDLSGNSHSATNLIEGDQPKYIAGALNGQPVLRFTQDNDDQGDRLFLGDLSASFPTAGSMFAVVTPNNDGRYNIFDNRNNDSRWMANSWSEAVPGVFRNGRTNLGTDTFSLWPQSGAHVFVMQSSSSAYSFAIDGNQIGTTGGDYHNGSGQNWVIANRPGAGQALNGDIAEFILFNRVLSPEEAQQMGAYLSAKYGLATAYIPGLIATFGVAGSQGVIDQDAKTIALEVPFGTDLATLAPNFTLTTVTASCDQTTGVPPTPTFASANPVVYTITDTATDPATVNAYSVTVTVAEASPAADILTFGPGAAINGTQITWNVPLATDVTTLSPTYTVSPLAAQDATYPSGSTRNFTSPQTYTITAQDLSTQIYTVTVLVASPPPNDNFADAISWPGSSGTQTGTNNQYATFETGEPAIGASNTVWFKWTAPTNGDLTISSVGSTDMGGEEWDAMLGFYTGTAVDSLTPLPGSPQDTGLEEIMSTPVTAGTTYYIQAAGYENDVALNIRIAYSFVSSGATYADWATEFAGGGAANEDWNDDGVQNGVAYFMGATGVATLPGLVDGVIAWPHSATAEGISHRVLISENLMNWTDVTDDAVDADGFLTYTPPTTSAKLFVRLEIVAP